MRISVLVGLLGIAGGVAVVGPDAVWGVYRDLYPSDPALRRALNECFTQDPRFNRLDATARDACIRHTAAVPPTAAAGPPTQPAPPNGNFVDLWRAAGQGRMPQNDVRAEQQNDRFIHPMTVTQAR